MDPESISKTAFRVPFGLFEYTRMPFGLVNAPGTFQRVMEMCLGDMNLSELLIYLDDILVFSPTVEDHVERLDKVFGRLADFGLKIKGEKCKLFRIEVSYLGHVVGSKGVSVDDDKIKRIQEWPVPQTAAQLRSFLVLAGYYRRFVRDFSKIAAPLHARVPSLVKGSNKFMAHNFIWSSEAQTAFDTLKEALTQSPVLSYPDFTRPFVLEVDASLQGLGACLCQDDEDGKRHPVAYASPKLGACEMRWVAQLAAFTFEVKFRSGVSNRCADALSRYPGHFSPEETEELAVTVARALRDHWFTKFGIPHRLHSDQGRNFEGEVVRELCALYGVKKTRTTPYHPEGNAQAKRFNRTMFGLIRSIDEPERRKWPAMLPHLVFVYNTTPHCTTGIAPYTLMFGREPAIPLDQMLGRSNSSWGQDFVNEQSKLLGRAWDLVRDRVVKRSNQNKMAYDSKANVKPISIGAQVLKRRCAFSGRHKLQDKYEHDPYVVTWVNEHRDVYKIRPITGGPEVPINRKYLRIDPTTESDPDSDKHSDESDDDSDWEFAPEPIENLGGVGNEEVGEPRCGSDEPLPMHFGIGWRVFPEGSVDLQVDLVSDGLVKMTEAELGALDDLFDCDDLRNGAKLT
ncbi:uncharacterized protein LOC119726358 [Patiria miniata]|uniref:Uncharacterized protein n=1 Tax=Patiria miniata TaxID=46514 RepID=A0A913ZQG9_PATMI|nr:uncharacterized protein LOC119726358 [Patiria miniata]